MADNIIYQTITAQTPLIPHKASKRMLTARNIYCILLLFQDKFLNFKENIGNSETKSNDITITNNNKYNALNVFVRFRPSIINIANELQKRALAGVGIPINDVV